MRILLPLPGIGEAYVRTVLESLGYSTIPALGWLPCMCLAPEMSLLALTMETFTLTAWDAPEPQEDVHKCPFLRVKWQVPQSQVLLCFSQVLGHISAPDCPALSSQMTSRGYSKGGVQAFGFTITPGSFAASHERQGSTHWGSHDLMKQMLCPFYFFFFQIHVVFPCWWLTSTGPGLRKPNGPQVILACSEPELSVYPPVSVPH